MHENTKKTGEIIFSVTQNRTCELPQFLRDFDDYDIMSVSYTHLRAHETSLHLVCRLLLEKKKGPQSLLNFNGFIFNGFILL